MPKRGGRRRKKKKKISIHLFSFKCKCVEKNSVLPKGKQGVKHTKVSKYTHTHTHIRDAGSMLLTYSWGGRIQVKLVNHQNCQMLFMLINAGEHRNLFSALASSAELWIRIIVSSSAVGHLKTSLKTKKIGGNRNNWCGSKQQVFRGKM